MADKRQFVNFAFYKVDPAWRRLPEAERRSGAESFSRAVLARGADEIILRTYSLAGIRADADLLLWRISYSLDALQAMSIAIQKSAPGKFLVPAYSYLSMSKRSTYIDKISPEHEESRVRIVPGKAKYLFVYPFVKTRDWYLLPLARRQEIMDEHIRVGNKYPSVKLNTTYSFGLDDQDFVVAFESNEPGDFLDLVQELRETESSRYTVRDTPTFTCVAKPLAEICADLV
ncbi:MAG: chlorite dismutase family protein [Deltaproteobacteria bacterium]|nr:chlorite dismutase family protein [Deltaproteobacteria bacterium]